MVASLSRGSFSSLKLTGRPGGRKAVVIHRAKREKHPQKVEIVAGVAAVVKREVVVKHSTPTVQVAPVVAAVTKAIYDAKIATKWGTTLHSVKLPRRGRKHTWRRSTITSQRYYSQNLRRTRDRSSSCSMKTRCGRSCTMPSMVHHQLLLGTSTMAPTII